MIISLTLFTLEFIRTDYTLDSNINVFDFGDALCFSSTSRSISDLSNNVIWYPWMAGQGRGAVGNEEPVAVLIRNQHHRFSKTLAFLFGDFTVCMMTRYPYYFILGILSSGTDLPVKC